MGALYKGFIFINSAEELKILRDLNLVPVRFRPSAPIAHFKVFIIDKCTKG